MTDTLRWVAEELLGFKGFPSELKYIQSWHGIGLVVEAMEKRGYGVFDLWKRTQRWCAEFRSDGEKIGNIEEGKDPWLAVFEAARKAVEKI